MKIMVASPLIVLSWVIDGELDMIDRVGKMATELIRAMMRAARLKPLPSCCVVVVGVGLDGVADVVLGGVPGPKERTICILLPLVGLLLAPIALAGVFTGAIAPVVRLIPVVPVALDGIFKWTEGLAGCWKKTSGTVTSGWVPVTGNGPGCDCAIGPVVVSRSCGISPPPIACLSLRESEKVGQEMCAVLGLGNAGTEVTGRFGSGGVITTGCGGVSTGCGATCGCAGR